MRRSLVFVCCLFASAAFAQDPVELRGNGLKKTVSCEGQDVVIEGNKNKITLTSECNAIFITGDRNEVRLDTATEISVDGKGNRVQWRFAMEGTPVVHDNGGKAAKNVLKHVPDPGGGPVVKPRSGDAEEEERPASPEGPPTPPAQKKR